MPAIELRPNVVSVLSNFRRQLGTHKSFASVLRASRAAFHFGPWRHVARSAIRVARPPIANSSARTLLPALDAKTVAAVLKSDGVCVAGRLPRSLVDRVRSVTDALPRAQYGSFHQGNADIAALVRDPAILSVARQYFGAEPELLECNLVIHDVVPQDAHRAPRPLGPGSQRLFHFDYAGWHSLNLFVYLTDVDDTSGAHEVAVGTHKGKAFRDAVRPCLDDEEALTRFGPQIRTITGPAGTFFFEDTEAFHRRAAHNKRRVMLNILFASHRSWFSHGRLVRPYVPSAGGAR